MPNVYDVGDCVELQGEFTDPDTHLPLDPTAVYLQIKTPSGTTTTYQYGVDSIITHNATGDYRAQISMTEAGEWYYRFYSTGAGQASGERSISVRQTHFP